MNNCTYIFHTRHTCSHIHTGTVHGNAIWCSIFISNSYCFEVSVLSNTSDVKTRGHVMVHSGVNILHIRVEFIHWLYILVWQWSGLIKQCIYNGNICTNITPPRCTVYLWFPMSCISMLWAHGTSMSRLFCYIARPSFSVPISQGLAFCK